MAGRSVNLPHAVEAGKVYVSSDLTKDSRSGDMSGIAVDLGLLNCDIGFEHHRKSPHVLQDIGCTLVATRSPLNINILAFEWCVLGHASINDAKHNQKNAGFPLIK